MGRAGRGPVGVLPEALTLLEALEGAPAVPTLVWGRGIGSIVRGLREGQAPVYGLAPDVTSARGIPEPVSVDVSVDDDVAVERVVALLPRSREELAWIVKVSRGLLDQGQELWLAGHHRDGIKSSARSLSDTLGPTVVARTKRHTRVLVSQCENPEPGLPDVDDMFRLFPVESGGETLQCASFPGTFSHGRLDHGTHQLLGVLESTPTVKRVLDAGAGCGALGATLLRRWPEARVTLCDHSASAVASARRTLSINGLDSDGRAEVLLSRAEDIERGGYDLVVTNPPFHVGRHQDRQLAQSFAAAAARLLTPQGSLLLVANRHLGYAEHMEAAFGRVDVGVEAGRFRVWRGRRPRRGT
ncbi:MAG: methyltransferase [Myxococcota bacterium]|nr:methyltransferase [Myxococcota bacterium]